MARDIARTVVGAVRWLGHQLVEPLRVDDELQSFTLSIPDAQTTTVDGDVGWANRPPAVVSCPQCGNEIHQSRSVETIDCPRCVGEFPAAEFPALELRYLRCPVCHSRMQHGTRHPNAIDVPEWATCERCRYHWEFEHF